METLVGALAAVLGGFLAQWQAGRAHRRQWMREVDRANLERRQSVVIQFVHHATDVALHGAGISATLGTVRRATADHLAQLHPMTESARLLARSWDELNLLEPGLLTQARDVSDACAAIFESATRGDMAGVQLLTKSLYDAKQRFVTAAASFGLATERTGEELVPVRPVDQS